MTDCITVYIRFCEDTNMPARTVHCSSNNKPWITSDLKALLNKKKRAFRSGDRQEQRRVQHELREMLRTCQEEAGLQQNSVRDVWTGMMNITGMKGKDRQTSGSLDRANQFNQFLNRFSSSPATLPQFVHLASVLSDVVVSDTGAPQGSVLSPFLFTAPP